MSGNALTSRAVRCVHRGSSDRLPALNARRSGSGAPGEHEHQMTRRRMLIVACIGVATCLGSGFVRPSHRLLYNPSPSVSEGWYAIVPARDVRVGTLVIARLPARTAYLADRRGYLPMTVPIIKRVAAAGGHHVCAWSGMVFIDGQSVARTLIVDGADRPLSAWPHCRTLAADEFFLLGEGSPDSFDSRYFGPVRRTAILGRAIPVWTW
jgi:conjugative transfer signal peptidase TraF